jgi:hypothetical protein
MMYRLAVRPPSTTTFVPVIPEAASEARKMKVSATSRGSMSRRNGTRRGLMTAPQDDFGSRRSKAFGNGTSHAPGCTCNDDGPAGEIV